MFVGQAYLDRLGLKHPPTGSAGLRDLQAAHMASVPFENIAPLRGHVPSLALADLQGKIVNSRRGGYCFELNGLFGAALEAFGYRPTIILGRVRNGAPEGGARLHQAFVVEADGRDWLLDVGFGGPGALWPLDLSEQGPQTVPNGTFRIRFEEATGETVVDRSNAGGWHALYGFDRSPVKPVDLDAANHLAATWPGAPFGTHLMMARHDREGRISLFNRKARVGEAVRLLDGVDDLGAFLHDRFGVELEPAEAADIWSRIRNLPTDRPS